MATDQQNSTHPPISFDEFTATSYAEWKETAEASLKGASFDKKLRSKTYEGITLEPIYTQAEADSFASRLTFPGGADYVRGTTAGGYLAQPWDIAQNIATADPAEGNALLKEELAKGSTTISLHLSQLNLETMADTVTLFSDLCLAETPMQIDAGASALPVLGLLYARAKELGYTYQEYQGCIGADPLSALARQGELAGDMRCYYQQMAAAMRWAKTNMPAIKTIFIQGSVYHNGGANAVQEVAASISAAIAYLDALQEEGFSVDEIARQIRFQFSQGANFFMEIAKLRAARMIWAQVVKAYGGSDEAAKMDIAVETSYFTTSVYDPYVNVLRATTQTFSGVLGGAQEISVTPFDAAVRPSDEQARRLARNIQIMMQNEFDLLSPVDPAGGSWYIETLTGQLAEAIWAELQRIDAAGGMLAVLMDGSLQAAIAEVLNARFSKLATRADRAVGVNMYPNPTEQPLAAGPAKAAASCKSSGCAPLDACVVAIGEAFQGGASRCDVEAALATGEKQSVAAILPHRLTEQYDALRARSEQHFAKTGKKVRVFLCNMGPIPQHKARADFAASFMEVASFEVLKNDGFASVEEAVAAATSAGADVAVLCSTDDTYPELVPALAAGIKAAAPKMMVLLAGMPAAEFKDSYDAAGVDDYIHVRSNCLQILTQIQKQGGICE